MSDAAKDAEIGRKAREVVQALQDAGAMIAVDAPTPQIVKQVRSIQHLAREVCEMCGVDFDAEVIEVMAQKQGRAAEVFMALLSEDDQEAG